MKLGKRLFDLAVSLVIVPVVLPLGLLVALVIKLVDGGPVLFRQERVGRGGRLFGMLKFRTMRPSTEPGLLVTVGEDPRITRTGRWLRRMKLDELPQLLHVLTGTMSLVGPRPEVPKYVAHYTPAQRRVLEVAPGITDPASVRYWSEGELLAQSSDPEATYLKTVMPDKIRMQLEYAEEATVWQDLLVLLHTLTQFWPATRPLVLERLVRHRRPFILAAQAFAVMLGYFGAYALRFDFAVPTSELHLFWITLPILVSLRLVSYRVFGLDRRYWLHFGLSDLLTLVQAVTIGSLGFTLLLAVVGLMPGISRSIVVLEWGAAIFLFGGVRAIARWLREGHLFGSRSGRRTLIIGAGYKAERLLREVRRDGAHPLRILGLVVDDPRAQRRTIHGVPVCGTTADLERLVHRHRIGFIVIALDEPSPGEMQRVVDRCLAARVEFKTLPSLQELLGGGAHVDELRTVRLDDLLGRKPVKLDLSRLEADLGGRVVLVTGAAGSIGSELARQIGRFAPARLVLLDQAESALYFLVRELAENHPNLTVVPIVGDITDAHGLDQVFARERPEYVLHAAAYKHVPMMEDNVLEAVRNNVFGTFLVAEAAAASGAGKFVLISSDKAVNPGSVMGASKRIAERVVLGLPSLRISSTDFRAVRFGNVLGSAGSVVPLFEQQLARGGPLTVTHPEVQRYFMTIPEAAQLVLEAAALPEAAGRILMLEMGEPVRILDLAERMIRLAGLEPHRDVRLVLTGLRPGEKLREELVSSQERMVPSGSEKIQIVDRCEAGEGLDVTLAMLAASLAADDVSRALEQICELVPECVEPLRSRGRSSSHHEMRTVEVALEL